MPSVPDYPSTSGHPGGAGPVRVFLLDDHEMVRRGVRSLLTDAGGFVVVGESASADEAARRIPAIRPDVALLDVQLPDGNGIAVCRQVRAVDPMIRALMFTTFDDDEARLSAALAGASGFVVKQIRGEALVESLHRVAAGESLLDSAAVRDQIRRGRQEHADPRLASLTERESQVLDLIVEGLTNRQIGERLAISEKTVRNRVTAVLSKLGFERRTQAATYAARAAAARPQDGPWDRA